MSPRSARRLAGEIPPIEYEAPTASTRFRIVVVLVVVFMVALLGVSVTGATIGARQLEQAALDTFSYVGDITAERVARYSNGARDMVEGMALSLERPGEQPSYTQIAVEMYNRLLREPEVRALYIGYPDGSYLSVRRDGHAYVERRYIVGVDEVMTDTRRDSFFRPLSVAEVEEDYDPRTRPWYMEGYDRRFTVWSEPYISVETGTTAASAVMSAQRDNNVFAVVGADLLMDSMTGILDDLPIGDGAEAFVLSDQRSVIAAPSSFDAQVARIIAATGNPPTAEDLNLTASPVLTEARDSYMQVGDRYVLERGFLPAEGLQWVLHLEADEEQLSPALARMHLTLAWVTGLSAVIVILGSILLYRLWQPLEQLRVRATTDSLTGLANRHECERRGARLLASAHRSQDPVVVAVMDLDDFKYLNDTYGHHMGDRALAVVGQALLANIRERDLAARIGGDEFVLIMRIRDGERATEVVDRIRETVALELASRVEGGDRVGATAGFTLADETERDLHVLMREADSALVTGKRQAKGGTYAWDRMDGRYHDA